jgi:hypothetical protein
LDPERTVAYNKVVLPVLSEASKLEDVWGSKGTNPRSLISSVCGDKWSGSCLDFCTHGTSLTLIEWLVGWGLKAVYALR